MEFKEKFVERYKGLTDFEKFQEAISQPARKSIRVNTIKISLKELKSKISGLKQVPWCSEGFYIERKETAVGNLKEHFLGYFYVQEAASMIPALILDPAEGDLVLDMSAAPGSKTAQMAAMMKNGGAIIANDVKWDRIKALSMNLQRCGVSNTVITIYKGEFFPDIKFDKILLDVPCSGEGNIRSNPKTYLIWNIKQVRKLSRMQRKIVASAVKLLRDGGELLYSTCTHSPEENEENVNFLLENFPLEVEKISLPLKCRSGIKEWRGNKFDNQIENACRIYPQDNDTEGFFLCKMKKTD